MDKEVLRSLLEESQRSRAALLKKTEDLSRRADELRTLIESNKFADKILEELNK